MTSYALFDVRRGRSKVLFQKGETFAVPKALALGESRVVGIQGDKSVAIAEALA